jgi:hypothetical protein
MDWRELATGVQGEMLQRGASGRSQNRQRSFSLRPEFSCEWSYGTLVRTLLPSCPMPDAKRFVYIIQSISRPTAYYVGLTSDVEARLTAHNAGLSPHTAAIARGDDSPTRNVCRCAATPSRRQADRKTSLVPRN